MKHILKLVFALCICSHAYSMKEHPVLLVDAPISRPPYEDYKRTIERRIEQGLTGENLIQPMNGRTDLFFNIIHSRVPWDKKQELFEDLINYDPSITQLTECSELLNTVIMNNKLDIARYLLAHGVNPADSLHLNQVYCKPPYIKLLLHYNANPNTQTKGLFNITVLHFNKNDDSFDEKTHCQGAQLLIVGGTDHTLKTWDLPNEKIKYTTNIMGELTIQEHHFSKKDKLRMNKTATELARFYNYNKLAQTIEQTAEQREALFKAVKNGDDISFVNTNGISRRHVRDIHGNNLLYYALYYGNIPIAKKLILLWPQLLTQPNFEDQTIIQILPLKSINFLQSIISPENLQILLNNTDK